MSILDKTKPHPIRTHIRRYGLSLCALALAFASYSYAQVPTPIQSETTKFSVMAPMPSSSMSSKTAAEIQKINENMTVLQAQLNELDLKAKIALKETEISEQHRKINDKKNDDLKVKNYKTKVEDVLSSFGSKSGNPSVVSVSGLKGSLEAVLVFPGGVTQRVKTDDVIDDRRVAKIAINEVILTDLKGNNIQRLGFGTSATMREAVMPSQNHNLSAFAPGVMPPPLIPPLPSMPGIMR